MRFRTALCLATILLFLSTVAAWSAPIPHRPAPASNHAARQPVTLRGNFSNRRYGFLMGTHEESGTKSNEIIDGDTKVEGKLEVGSQAKVEHRSADGRNVAGHVVVIPTSGNERSRKGRTHHSRAGLEQS